jgi:hypothetical protein
MFQGHKALQPSKSVRLGDIPASVTKGCSYMFIPVFKFILNSSLPQWSFCTLWKQAAVVPVFKKGKSASVIITDQFLFSISCPEYLNLLSMNIFHTSWSPNLIHVSVDLINPNLPLPFLFHILTLSLCWFILSSRLMLLFRLQDRVWPSSAWSAPSNSKWLWTVCWLHKLVL